MKYEDKYNNKKHWEITIDKSGHYHISQFVNGELTRKVRTTKKWIKEVGILDMEPILPVHEKLHNERNAGRKKTVDVKLIHDFRDQGKTQEWTAREMNVSISTIRRNWNK